MKLLTRLGDTLLSKLAPEAEAHAGCYSCSSGACNTARPDGRCTAGRRFVRCCYSGGSACPTPYCGSWEYCGMC
ncbi:hypothetical protein ACFV0R_18005 [Streptomyces sp. NPDC059578]|uniref:hypothetical protein n=1 Tax=unclassified Streptomyces TaxID=2593676 RepID=UPI00365D18E9